MGCGDHGIIFLVCNNTGGLSSCFLRYLSRQEVLEYLKAGMKEKYMVKNLCVFGRQYKIYPPLFSGTVQCFLPGASSNDLQASSHRNISDWFP